MFFMHKNIIYSLDFALIRNRLTLEYIYISVMNYLTKLTYGNYLK